MAQSQVALYNLALALIGHRYTVVSAGEQSIPAETCTLFYEPVRQSLFRAAHWSSCKRAERLVEDTARDDSAAWVATDPLPGWAYSYTPPTDMVAARYMSDYSPFEVGFDSGGKIINSNVGGEDAADAPILLFTKDITTPTVWEPDLYLALAHALAAYISLPLTGKTTKSQMLLDFANAKILEARAASANDRQQLFQPIPEVLQLRGYASDMPQTMPYVVPYGPLFTSTGAPVV